MPVSALTISPAQPSEPAAADLAAWKEVTLLVAGAASDYAAHGNAVEVESFRRLVREATDTFGNSPSVSQMLIAAGVVSQAIRHCGVQNQNRWEALTADLDRTARTLLDHFEKLSSNGDAQAAVLKLRATVESALRADRLPAVHAAIEATGERLLDEMRRERAELAERCASLQDRVAGLEKSASHAAKQPVAAITTAGIEGCAFEPMRAQAEDALRRAQAADLHCYAAIVYVHRLSLINARYGEAFGNQVIQLYSQHIISTLAEKGDALFRWRGPAFVVILRRSESRQVVIAEVQRMISAPLSRFIQTPTGSVYVPVRATAEVMPLFEPQASQVVSRIEEFILQASGQTAE
ncbi:MAG: diguanylate cyclase [Acidobacteriota bacterium]